MELNKFANALGLGDLLESFAKPQKKSKQLLKTPFNETGLALKAFDQPIALTPALLNAEHSEEFAAMGYDLYIHQFGTKRQPKQPQKIVRTLDIKVLETKVFNQAYCFEKEDWDAYQFGAIHIEGRSYIVTKYVDHLSKKAVYFISDPMTDLPTKEALLNTLVKAKAAHSSQSNEEHLKEAAGFFVKAQSPEAHARSIHQKYLHVN